MVFYGLTDEKCILQGAHQSFPSPDIPVFYDSNGIIRALSDYMIFKKVIDTDQASSVLTYADQLQTFFKYIDSYPHGSSAGHKKLTWAHVTDRHLIEWRNLKLEEVFSNKR